MHGSEHMRRFRWFRSIAVVFQLFKVFSLSLQHISRTTGQTFTISWSKMKLSWVLMLYYLYKMMFSVYKSVIVTPCTFDLFVSKVMKITRYMIVRFWRSFFSAFSVCNDCILKSTTAWLLKLSVLYIHSLGTGIAQWLERRTCDWKVPGSNPCRSGGRIFFSGVDFLYWLLFQYLFHPCVTAVARKRSRSFCQKVQVAGYS